MNLSAKYWLVKGISHILMWCCIGLFFNSFFSVGSDNESFIFWYGSILSVITIATIYVFNYHLIPNFLLEKHYRYFAVYTIYALIFVICATLMTIFFGFTFFFNLEYQRMPDLTKNPNVIIVCVLLMLTVASTVKIVKFNFLALEEKKTLENKFLQAQLKLKEEELKYLKNQIHPHFLFNTLNTLYGFSLKKSEQTSDLILKLSSLLDYILYQSDKTSVFLKDEIQHIYDYAALEQMRFSDTLKIDFQIQDFSETLRVSPMLLLPFVENAFKHGTAVDGILRVIIKLEIKAQQLIFTVDNSCAMKVKKTNGIGLSNIKKRLELLYDTNFDLRIHQQNNEFKTSLKIPIKYES